MDSKASQHPTVHEGWNTSSESSASPGRRAGRNDPKYSHAEHPFREHSDEITVAHSEHHFSHAEHGPPIDNIGPAHDLALEEYAEHEELLWSRIRNYIRDPAAEFCGTMIMIIFGDGSVAQVVLSSNPKLPASSQNKGAYQSISWGWGLGVMLGVYVAGCAGGHLNPAVTFVNCLYRGFPWKKWFPYACAQVSGCFCGAAIIYGNYKSAIDAYEGGPGIRTVPGYSQTATAGVFCTYPQPFMERVGMFFSEFIASAVLIFVIFALKDDANLGAGNLVPLALFFLIFGLGATLGWETGYAINLARDFGPRLFTYFVGYGHNVWSAGGYYFWIPMVAPFLGATFGGFLYDFLLYTGDSPINTPWLGLKRVVRLDFAAVDEKWHARRSGAQRRGDIEAGNARPWYKRSPKNSDPTKGQRKST